MKSSYHMLIGVLSSIVVMAHFMCIKTCDATLCQRCETEEVRALRHYYHSVGASSSKYSYLLILVILVVNAFRANYIIFF